VKNSVIADSTVYLYSNYVPYGKNGITGDPDARRVAITITSKLRTVQVRFTYGKSTSKLPVCCNAWLRSRVLVVAEFLKLRVRSNNHTHGIQYRIVNVTANSPVSIASISDSVTANTDTNETHRYE